VAANVVQPVWFGVGKKVSQLPMPQRDLGGVEFGGVFEDEAVCFLGTASLVSNMGGSVRRAASAT
jgi:hypothetical protein